MTGLSKTTRMLLGLAMASLAVASCRDNSPAAPHAPKGSPSASVLNSRHPGEAAFEEVSAQVPSFAGYFVDGPSLVILVTDSTADQAAAEAVLRGLVARGVTATESRLAHARPVIRHARFTFLQLRQWRDQIEQSVWTEVPDVAWVDLDEVNDQVAIGLGDGSGRQDLAGILARASVPQEAVRVEVTGRGQVNATLQDRIRPLAGGLANSATFSGTAQIMPFCTYSFTARYYTLNVILTASHCTAHTFETDPPTTVFYQDSIADSNRVGTEWYDPPGFSPCMTPLGYNRYCHRYSDAAMILLDAGADFELGSIARTMDRSIINGYDGSKIINSDHPRFYINGVQEYPVLGERVEKVGWKTGWTSGLVDATCVDLYLSDGFVRDCSYEASYWSHGGDSGSPIFSWSGTGDSVTLVGIHFGRDASDTLGLFSPMGGVYQDFGVVTTYPPPPPLSVSISGPSRVKPNQACGWWANPTGGVPPYSYSWVPSGTMDGNEVIESFSASGTLTAWVSDAAGQQASKAQAITVSQSAPNCPN